MKKNTLAAAALVLLALAAFSTRVVPEVRRRVAPEVNLPPAVQQALAANPQLTGPPQSDAPPPPGAPPSAGNGPGTPTQAEPIGVRGPRQMIERLKLTDEQRGRLRERFLSTNGPPDDPRDMIDFFKEILTKEQFEVFRQEFQQRSNIRRQIAASVLPESEVKKLDAKVQARFGDMLGS